MLTVSGKCCCPDCLKWRTQDIYRMVGKCHNCHTEDILMIFRSGEEARTLSCPVCNTRNVMPTRLATDDEIPVDEKTRGYKHPDCPKPAKGETE